MVDADIVALIRNATTDDPIDWWIAMQQQRTPQKLAALGWPHPHQGDNYDLLRLIEADLGQRAVHQALADHSKRGAT